MEENKWHFWPITISRKVQMQLIRKKQISAMYGESAVTDWTCQKRFAKLRGGDFLLDVALHSQVDRLKLTVIKLRHWEQSTLYHAGDSQHTENIQINKVIDENEKYVFVLWKETKTFWPTQKNTESKNNTYITNKN